MIQYLKWYFLLVALSMEWLICPLCKRQGLIQSQGANVPDKRVICENEFYKHFKIGETHFLARLVPEDDQKPDIHFSAGTGFFNPSTSLVLN